VDLAFALISGAVLTGTATAIYLGQIPPGGRWFFRAQFVDYDGQILVSKSETVLLSAFVNNGSSPGWLKQNLSSMQCSARSTQANGSNGRRSMANDNAKTASVFAIHPDNRVDAYAAGEAPEGSVLFSSETELAAISASWPAKTLLDMWNRLPDVAAVSKFTDRKMAVRRIWQALTGPTERRRSRVRTQKAARKRGTAKATAKTQPAGTKTERILALLKRPDGATLQAIMTATGWQPHSVRGFISAQLTKRMG